MTLGDRSDLRPFAALGMHRVVSQLEIEEEDVHELAILAASSSNDHRLRAPAQLGGLVGATVGVPLSSCVTLGGTLGYRYIPELTQATFTISEGGYEYEAEFDALEGWNMSGLTAGLELRYAL